MQQLAGNENRPGQLGDTGIIVLKECDMGECDCIEVLKEEKKKKEIKTTESPSKLRRPVTKVRESSGTVETIPIQNVKEFYEDGMA